VEKRSKYMSYVKKSKRSKGVVIDDTKGLEVLDGYGVDITDDDGLGNVLEARVGRGLNEPIPERIDDNRDHEWDPDYIIDPTGQPDKWYIQRRNLTIGNLTCSNCGDAQDKDGVIARCDYESKDYVVAQCGKCKGYLFAELVAKG
jgi:hypothetical protein